MAVAYDANDDIIVLFGGDGGKSYSRQLAQFRYPTFLSQQQNYLSNTYASWSYSQHYTTHDNTLWMIHQNGNELITIPLQAPYIASIADTTIPINVNTGGCLTSTAHYLLIVGADSNGKNKNEVQIHDISNNQWLNNVPSLLTGRGHVACLAVNDYVFAIGGFTGAEPLDSIEKLDVSDMSSIDTKVWQYVSGTLRQPTKAVRAVQYGFNIITLGGSLTSEESGFRVTDVHLIDTVTGTCSKVGDLAVNTAYIAPIIVDNILYGFGGWSNNDPVGALDIYQMIQLPTSAPIKAPSKEPSLFPTTNPLTSVHTVHPTSNPSMLPISPLTSAPTGHPITTEPSKTPSLLPTINPSMYMLPTISPLTSAPTEHLITTHPSGVPSKYPSKIHPTLNPNPLPTTVSTLSPTLYSLVTSHAPHIVNTRIITYEIEQETDWISVIIVILVSVLCVPSMIGGICFLKQRKRMSSVTPDSTHIEQTITNDFTGAGTKQNSNINNTKGVFTTSHCNAVLNKTVETQGNIVRRVYLEGEEDRSDSEELYDPGIQLEEKPTDTGGELVDGNGEEVKTGGTEDGHHCVDCGIVKAGKIYAIDGLFYCNDCLQYYY
eukprot:32118_1